MRVIHWFRSDLRLADNTALAAASRWADGLVPVFVLDDTLLEQHREAHPRLRFLHACLDDLAGALEAAGSRLIVVRGTPHRCVPALARTCKASLVTWNRDYGPYAGHRDQAVRSALERGGVEVRTYKNRVVFEGSEIRTVGGGTYSVYSHFRRAWWRRYRTNPSRTVPAPALPPCIPEASSHATLSPLGRGLRADGTDIARGGAGPARERLDAFLGGPAHRYHVDREFPAVAGTSRLSPYLRFGAISVRECLRAVPFADRESAPGAAIVAPHRSALFQPDELPAGARGRRRRKRAPNRSCRARRRPEDVLASRPSHRVTDRRRHHAFILSSREENGIGHGLRRSLCWTRQLWTWLNPRRLAAKEIVMSAKERFGIFSYEIIEDGEGMEGFDEVMYQTAVMLGLASALPDRLPRVLEDE